MFLPGTDLKGIFAVIPGGILGGWLMLLLISLFQMALAPAFNLEVIFFQIFGKKFLKKDGKIITQKTRFSLFPSVFVGPHPGETIKKEKDNLFTVLVFFVPSLLAIGISVAYVITVKERFFDGLLRSFLSSFLFGVSFFAIASMVICLRSIGLFGKTLHQLRNQKVREIYSNDDINSVYMPSLDEVKDYKGSKIDQLSYQTLRFVWAEMRRDINIMGETAEWMRIYDNMNTDLGTGLSPIKLGFIRSLVIYYSTWNIDPDRARKYYAYAASDLDSDDDINGLRLRAYYTMNILNDRNTALDLAKKGVNKPSDPRFSKIEENHERKLLQELVTFIEGADNEQ